MSKFLRSLKFEKDKKQNRKSDLVMTHYRTKNKKLVIDFTSVFNKINNEPVLQIIPVEKPLPNEEEILPIVIQPKPIQKLTNEFKNKLALNLKKEFEEDLISIGINENKFNFLEGIRECIDELEDNLDKQIERKSPNSIFLTLNENNFINSFSSIPAKKSDPINNISPRLSVYNKTQLKHKKEIVYPYKVTTLAKSLNIELNRISYNYGKIDSLKRFKDNPRRDFYYNQKNYNAYRTHRFNESTKIYKRVKLEPLYKKESAKEKLANSLFFMRNNIMSYLQGLLK